MTCHICLGEITNANGLEKLERCQHEFCSPCLVWWLETSEVNRKEQATCPTCRQEISIWDVVRILGRPLQKVMPPTTPVAEEPDEFTLCWLKDQGAKQCPGCSVWIVREHGCNQMECLCGQEFCYCCGEINCPNMYDRGEYDDDDWSTGYSDYGYEDYPRWYTHPWEEWEQERDSGFDSYAVMEAAKSGHGGKAARKWKGNSPSRHRGKAAQDKKKKKSQMVKKRRGLHKKDCRILAAQR